VAAGLRRAEQGGYGPNQATRGWNQALRQPARMAQPGR